VTRQPRVCGACGAKNRAGWRKCQRCKSPLPAVVAVEKAEEPPASTARAASLVPIAVGLALVAIAGVLLTRGSKAAPSTAASGASASRAASTPLSKANTRHSADESERAAGAPVTAADFARRAGESFRANDFATALTAFETAVAGRPDDPDALNNLGQTLVRLNRVPEAIPRFALAVQLAPGKWAYRFNLARARGLVGDWAGAVEDYRIADRLFPDDHATLFNLALALRKAGRPAEALPVLEKVVALAPEDPSFVLTTARTYDELDRRADAAASYRKFLSQSATGPDADAARGRLAALEAPDGQ
jgi:Flp pilus assembly protein TadD